MTQLVLWLRVVAVVSLSSVLCAGQPSAAQKIRPTNSETSAISVSRGTLISADESNTAHAESFLAINPKDPNNWLATSIVIRNGATGSDVYVSRDGGKTWQRGRARNNQQDRIFAGIDPVVYFDPSGTAFFGTIQGTPIGFLLSRSLDGGSTWEDSVTVPGGTYDREYLAFDKTGGTFDGRMYLGGMVSIADADGQRRGSISIVSSQDGGKTLSGPRVLTGYGTGEQMLAIGDLLVTSTGKLIIPFYTRVPNDAKRAGHLWTAVSEDGGATFTGITKGPAYNRGPDRLHFRSKTMPRAAIDASHGPFRDRIYLTWLDYNGDNGDRYLLKTAYSSDSGKTWSTPVPIHDYTDDNIPTNAAPAVNKDGTVGIVFNDRRDDTKTSCYQLYFAVSLDGGQTFLPNVRASEKPTCPTATGNWGAGAASYVYMGRSVIQFTSIAGRWPNGGDTQGLVAGNDGVFHAAWINGETGIMQLWSKDFSVDRKLAPQSTSPSPQRKDLSRDFTLEIGEPVLDFVRHTVSVNVRLQNPLPIAMQGPFTLVLDELKSPLKDLRAVNADNSMPGKGAAWTFTAGGRNELAPKQKSEQRQFLWEFAGGIPEEPAHALFYASFQILGAPAHQ